ncbi:ribulose phosphate epimerase [Clostridium beijerinckii]|nr:ribulose phosphate epimerase [Clostridium beijerinckii]
MCANQLELHSELKKLENAKVDLLHCDVMDGVFVNNLAMGPYVLEQIKSFTNIPLDIHLATVDTLKYIDMYSYLNPEYISFHIEASKDVERDIKKIKSKGIKASIAISPETSLESVKPYLQDIDMILVMTVNPGFSGQKFNYKVLDKLDELNKYLSTLSNRPLIEVDGCINKETVRELRNKQIDVYVLGTSALFNNNIEDYKSKINEIK